MDDLHPSTEAAPTDASLEPSADFASDAAMAARAARRIEVVERLIEMGLELTDGLHRQAMAQIEQAVVDPEAPVVDGDAAELKFSRLAKTVRMCLALGARLGQDLIDQRRRAEAVRVTGLVEQARARKVTRRRAVMRKVMVREMVEKTIDATIHDDDVAETRANLRERLVDHEGNEDAEFADAPIGVLVARICRDLGVTPDWSLLQGYVWAIEEAATLPPGSPFIELARRKSAAGVAGCDGGPSAHPPPVPIAVQEWLPP